MSNEGPECQQKSEAYAIRDLIPTYSIRLVNEDGEEVGVLDFKGPGLSFEGNADQSAMIFMEFVSKQFQQRLKNEYNKGYKAGKAST